MRHFAEKIPFIIFLENLIFGNVLFQKPTFLMIFPSINNKHSKITYSANMPAHSFRNLSSFIIRNDVSERETTVDYKAALFLRIF